MTARETRPTLAARSNHGWRSISRASSFALLVAISNLLVVHVYLLGATRSRVCVTRVQPRAVRVLDRRDRLGGIALRGYSLGACQPGARRQLTINVVTLGSAGRDGRPAK